MAASFWATASRGVRTSWRRTEIFSLRLLVAALRRRVSLASSWGSSRLSKKASLKAASCYSGSPWLTNPLPCPLPFPLLDMTSGMGYLTWFKEINHSDSHDYSINWVLYSKCFLQSKWKKYDPACSWKIQLCSPIVTHVDILVMGEES